MVEPHSAGSGMKLLKLVVPKLVRWGWRRMRPDVSHAALARHADELAELVLRVESQRMRELGVVRGQAIDIHWDAGKATRSTSAPGSLGDIIGYYDEHTRGRLMLLGDAGSGKTVTALHLMLDLLERRATDGATRIPVRIDIAGWNPRSAGFTAWLADRIAVDYSLHRRVVRGLIETERILPILDGLDEMDPLDQQPLRARDAIHRLNETEWRGRPLVLTCRSGTYHSMRALPGAADLRGSTMVMLRALNIPKILDCLRESCEDTGLDPAEWEPVTDRLDAEPEGALAVALGTPWLLTLAIAHLTNGGAAAAAELAAATDDKSILDLLFSALIPTAVAGLARDAYDNRKYSEHQVGVWLTTLANHLAARRRRGRGGAGMALNEVWELDGVKSRLLHGVIAFLMVWVSAWFSIGFSVVTGGSTPGSELLLVLLLGGILTAIFALPFGLIAGLPKSTRAHRMVLVTRKRGGSYRWRKSLAPGLLWGLVVLPFNIWGSEAEHTRFPVLAPVLWSVCIFIGYVLLKGLTGHRQPHLDERRIIRDDAWTALTIAVACWLPLVVVAGAYGASTYIDEHGISMTTAVAVCVGLIVGILWGGGPIALFFMALAAALGARASLRYVAAKTAFRLGDRFPGKPAPFLDWARRAGLLRVTGAAYQFRHETYGQWLTTV